jgi:hypothetical protein
MSLRNHLIFPIALSALAMLASCGGNGASPIVNPMPPPSGGFSASNLNGTYVFSVSGIDLQGFPYVVAGTFTANGQGGITGGTIDVNDAGLSAPVANSPLTSNGSYKVGVDGRGQAALGTSVLGTINLDFVLQDSTHGFVTQFDGNATGSGSLDLQAAGVTPAGSYAFSFSGADFTGGSVNSFATVGNFTVGSNGSITGLQDLNDGQFAFPNEGLSGSLVLGPSSTPSTVLSTGFGALTFDVFAIDATHLKFIEMDAGANLIGDAFSQTSTAFPSGTLAFTLEGLFPSTSTFSAAGGFMVSDGAGNITTASTVDANNGGSVSPAPISFSGTYTAAGTGRYTLALSSFTDGTAYAAYPFNGGVLLLEIDNSGIMAGAAYRQSQTAFSAPDGYGLNFTGANLNNGVEVDEIAEFTADSNGTTVTGVVDENFQPGGGPNLGLGLSGTYAPPDANGRGQLAANAGNSNNSTLNGGFGLTFYSVDGTTFPFIQTDGNGQITAGAFFKQNSGAASANATQPQHLFLPQPMMRAKSTLKKK